MRRVLLAPILLGVAALGAVIGLLTAGVGTETTAGHAVAAASGAHPFAVGSCFYGEGTNAGSALRPASCDGDNAVFVINAVVPDAPACGQIADFGRFGAVQRDVSAHVVYCVSLVLKQNSCVLLGRDTPSHRVDCGADPAASRVVKVVSNVGPATACRDVANADVWYSRGPSSGQIACLARDAG